MTSKKQELLEQLATQVAAGTLTEEMLEDIQRRAEVISELLPDQ